MREDVLGGPFNKAHKTSRQLLGLSVPACCLSFGFPGS